MNLAEINEKAISLSSGIEILKSLSWKVEDENSFLSAWDKGNPQLPQPTYDKVDLSEQKNGLEKLLSSFTAETPEEQFTSKTITGLIRAINLIESIGTPNFTQLSYELYGHPSSVIPGSSLSGLSAAQKLLEVFDKFDHPFIKEPEICLSAEQVQADIVERSKEVFGDTCPQVIIDATMASKAAAGGTKIRLRSGTCYNLYDPDQLFYHEAMIHSLTAINGRQQPTLKLLAKGSPQTTKAQEGLATFSELITGSMDLHRLKRLALRVYAVDMALQGADFIDVFKFFLENNYSQKESFWSTARIFRGSQLKTGENVVFTKDAVYLEGLIKISALFRWALIYERMKITHLMFCGRLTIEDAFLLEESIDSGVISHPKFLPPWYKKIEGLAGAMAFHTLTDTFDLEDFESHFTNERFL